MIRPDWKPRSGQDVSFDSTSPESAAEELPPLSQEQQLPELPPSNELGHQDEPMEDISKQLENTKLDMVPKQVKFGHKRGGKGFRDK